MKTIGVYTSKRGFHEKWVEYIHKYGYDTKRVDFLGSHIFKNIEECSAIMWHLSMLPTHLSAASAILNAIEHNHIIPVFPNWKTRWHFEDKIAQYYLLKALNIPIPETNVLWDKEEALQFVEEASFPLVFKLARGAASINVEKILDRKHARNIVLDAFSGSGILSEPGYFPVRRRDGYARFRNRLANVLVRLMTGSRYILIGKLPPLPRDWWMPEKNYVLFQELLVGNDYDTRVTIIGDRAFAFRRLNRSNDFRASGSGSINHDPSMIDLNAVEIAFDISSKCGFQSMAYDFLYDAERRLKVSEISFGYQNVAVHDCPGYWDSHLNWHDESMWPEEAHVVDLIALIETQ